jgi:hypothetical protein
MTIENEVLKALIDLEDNALAIRKLFSLINATNRMSPYTKTALEREYDELQENVEIIQQQMKELFVNE